MWEVKFIVFFFVIMKNVFYIFKVSILNETIKVNLFIYFGNGSFGCV